VTRPILSLALVLLLAAQCWADIHVLNAVNLRRVQSGYQPVRYHSALMAVADRSVRMQAARGRMGHVGGMLSGTWEGVGYQHGNDPYGRRISTCYHFPNGRGNPGTDTRAYWAGAAAYSVGGRTYYTFVWAPANWKGAGRR